jgi:hypothetical protein
MRGVALSALISLPSNSSIIRILSAQLQLQFVDYTYYTATVCILN